MRATFENTASIISSSSNGAGNNNNNTYAWTIKRPYLPYALVGLFAAFVANYAIEKRFARTITVTRAPAWMTWTTIVMAMGVSMVAHYKLDWQKREEQ
jgi:hypothetical protein